MGTANITITVDIAVDIEDEDELTSLESDLDVLEERIVHASEGLLDPAYSVVNCQTERRVTDDLEDNEETVQ